MLFAILKFTTKCYKNAILYDTYFWAMEEAHGILQRLASLNPFAYLVGVYRTAFVHGNVSVYGQWHDHLYFWLLTIILLLIGSLVHSRFKQITRLLIGCS